jgi:hypothetical protein
MMAVHGWRIAMTFRRGMKRLALFLGVLGMIAGGTASYIELSSLLAERSHHRKFEQLVSTDAVRKLNGFSIGDLPLSAATKAGPPPDDEFVPNPDYRPQDSEPSELTKSGIAEVHWTQDHEVDYIKTTDGQYYFAGSAPSWWEFLLTLTLPVIGFLIPWGFVNALVWVGSGFIEPQS